MGRNVLTALAVVAAVVALGYATTPKEYRHTLLRLAKVERVGRIWYLPWTGHLHFIDRKTGEMFGYVAEGKVKMMYGPCPHCS